VSKFKGILDAAKGREPEKSSQQAETQKLQSRSADQSQIEPPPKRGRPKAKRSDPNYEQVTAYIRKDTHTIVKIELLKSAQDGQKREFSELIQDLLEQWLESRT
jgi:hypothetical protein